MRVSIPVFGWLLLATGGMLWGQGGYSVGVALADRTAVRLSSLPGMPVTYAPPQYNAATQYLDLQGSFTIPVGRMLNDFSVNVNGRNVAVNVGGGVGTGGGGTMYGFTVSIPLPGATPGFGGWTSYTFGTILSDPDNIAKPIIAELYDGAQSVLRARQLITIFDLRNNTGYDLNSGNTSVSEGLQMEVTGQGLDNLESLHTAGLPHPTVSDYEGALSADFRRKTFTAKTDTTIGTATAACQPLSSLNGWEGLPEYGLVFAEANTQYAAYVTAQEFLRTSGVISGAFTAALTAALPGAGTLIGALVSGMTAASAQAIVNQSCVQELVLPSRFEVCAGSLKGDGNNLKLQSVAGVDLSLGSDQATPPHFLGQPTLGPIEAKVLGKFQGLFFRYSHAPGRSCKLRPMKTILETNLVPRPSLDQQRTCNLITMTGPGATSNGALMYTLKEGAGGQEHIDLHAGTQAANYFQLSGPRNADYPGWCRANLGMIATSREVVNRFWTHATASLNTTWSDSHPRTRQAQALEGIFRTWELGTWGEANLATSMTGADHQLGFNYFESKSKNLRDRLYARMDTSGLVPGKPLQSYFHFQPSLFPCSHNLCGNNRTENRTTYDVSFMYTTGALNQIVSQLAATELLTFNWEPTYQELGVAPPPGVQVTEKAVLDGPTLSNLHAAFAEIGSNPVSIRVTPVIKPFFYINPQPVRGPNPALGQENLVYSSPYLQIEVSNLQGTWLRGASYVYDVDFQLTPFVSADKLMAAWGQGPVTVGMAVSSSFTGCLGQYYTATTPGCPDAAYNALFARLRPLVTSRLLYMADRFPAPLRHFSGTQRREFLLAEKYQEDQVVAFYGNLQ